MKKLFLILLSVTTICLSSIAQDVKLPERPKRSSYIDYSECDKGFWCAIETEAGSSIAFKHKNVQAASLTYTAGYRISEFLKLGVGIGGRYYFNNNEDVRDTDIDWAFPIFANFRGNIISQEIRSMVPYWSLNIGGVIRDGFYLSPTIGLRFGENRNSWLIGISYGLHQLKVFPDDTEFKNFISLKIGYEF